MASVLIKPHKRRRHYAIELDEDDAIIVRTPMRPSKRMVNRLLDDYRDWIRQHQCAMAQRRAKLHDWYSSSLVYIQGVPYKMMVSDVSEPICHNGDVHCPISMDRAQLLHNMAVSILPDRCQAVADMMGVSLTGCRIKPMRSCWGTCNRHGSICLNVALIQAPDWVSDYVPIPIFPSL